MIIAVNTRFLQDPLEGIGQYSYHILRQLCHSHPEIRFHFIFDRAYDKKYIFSDNITAHVLFPPARHPILWYLWYEYSLPALLKRISPDLFFSPDNFLSLNSDIPTLLTCHDLAFRQSSSFMRPDHEMYYKHFMPKYLRRADAISCVSQSIVQEISELFPIEKSKIRVAYNAPDSRFVPLSSEKQLHFRQKFSGGTPYFLYLGSIHPRKNIHTLVQAFNLFKGAHSSDQKLVLAGRWAWETKAVKRAVLSSPYAKDILLIQNFDPFIHDLVASSTCLVYPSLYEGFGIPIVEAMACGVPVICSDRGAMKEISGSAALLIDPEKPEDIAEKMQSVLMDQNLAQSLARMGLEHSRHFSWEKSAEQIYGQMMDMIKMELPLIPPLEKGG